MRLLHHVWLTVHCKEEDTESDVVSKLRSFFPFILEDEKIKIDQSTVTGFEERKILIFQVHLEKAGHINHFLKHLNEILSAEQKELILKQKESRLDSENYFFIRFDKQKLLLDDEYVITDEGNCYHLKMSIAAYPATKEKAMSVVDQLFTL